ncbi:MAG TPA: hypothetical protein VGN23_12130 [Verrucomicrobiae bacterium]|jgi:hypothetical protein
MLDFFETNPPVNVEATEYKRLLGYPARHVLEGRPRELAEAAQQWYAQNGKPWFYAHQFDKLGLANNKVRIGGVEFSSKQLFDLFAEARVESAVVLAVSAGPECEDNAWELWQQSKPDEYFFMEIFGSAVVEHLVTVASGRICGWADQQRMMALPHYSPGYSGWDVADQNKLWDLVRQSGSTSFNSRLNVLDTGMLDPKKSLLAVFGLTRHLDKARKLARLIPCENCSLSRCQYRRGPYKHALAQIEDVQQLQSNDAINDMIPIRSVLNHNAKYSVNARALQKWSQERLHLKFLHDGSVEAHFRYDGSTCTNMGRPLQFDYRVRLSAAQSQYTILEAACAPSPQDTGCEYQCEYINNAEALMRSISTEKPLLGKPLNDILAWRREYNPSSCYCDVTRREHKWGLAYEVIHFALVQHEKETAGAQLMTN